MGKEKELLSKEELALMRGGFGIEDVTVLCNWSTRCKQLL